MDSIALRDIFYIGGIILSAVVTFLTTKHRLKELIRDKHEENYKAISDLKLEIERLRGRDELQQQVIEQFKDQVLANLPKMFQLIENSKNATRK